MTDYKLYPPIPSVPPDVPPQVGYHLNVVQAKTQGLIAKEKMFKKKYKKYNRILNRLTLNACWSRVSVATGISGVATFATFIVTPALVVFERAVSDALKNGVINEEEFNMLQTLHLETLNELTGIDRRMEAEHRSLVEKSLLEEINEMKKNQAARV